MNPITIAQLNKLKNDDPIDLVEGVLVGVYDAKTPDAGGYFQNGSIKIDGKEHRICFAAEECGQDKKMKGKRYRITCHTKNDGGKSGLKMKIEEFDDKVYRKIWVTGSATIEVIGTSPSSGGGSKKTGSSKSSSVEESASSGGGEEGVEAITPVKHRITRFFDILELVNAEYDARKEKLSMEIASDDILKTAIHISMSYKGRFGSYQTPPMTDAECQSTDGGSKPGMGAISGWKDFIHSKSEMKLGVMMKENLPKFHDLMGWAFHIDESKLSKEAKLTKINFLAAAEELQQTAETVFQEWAARKGGEGSDWTWDDFEAWRGDEELTPDDYARFLRTFDVVIAELKKRHAEADGGDVPE